MKNILCIICTVFLIGCNNSEEPLTSSLPERNWFVIEDDPSNPLRHACYEVFAKTGIPIFYNDLLGTENRGKDGNGNPIIFEKRLDINYNIATSQTSKIVKQFTLLEDENDIINGITFVRDYVIPQLPRSIFTYSFFLVDELFEPKTSQNERKDLKIYQAMNTFVIANITQLKDFSEEEKQTFMNSILPLTVLNFMMNDDAEDVKKYLSYTIDPVTKRSYYNAQVRKPNYPDEAVLTPKRWEEYGFLDYYRGKGSVPVNETTPVSSWKYKMLDQESDIKLFIEANLSMTYDEFQTKYKTFNLVMLKYEVTRKILIELGFNLK